MRQTYAFILVLTLFVLGLVTAALFVLPLHTIRWGSIKSEPGNTITVIGEAKSQVVNQTATFTAGVDSVQNDKEAAIEEVNSKIQAITEAVKRFGVPDKDIKTQNLSVYRSEESYWEEGTQRFRPGQWRVSNSITIKISNLDRASELTQVITDAGATNVYGPSLALEDDTEAFAGLLNQAVVNARTKAEAMVAGTGKKVGSLVSVTEGSQTGSLFESSIQFQGGGGGGMPIEPGSTTVTATVVVVYELE